MAGGWLRARLMGRPYSEHEHLSGYVWDLVVGLIAAGILLLAIKGFMEYRIKETVFDGWLDSLVDLIYGSSDRDEDVAECIELLGDDPVCRL